MSANESKGMDVKKINNLTHFLNPKLFIRMFTIAKCTFEEKLIRDILKCICALRNSGGGKVTIWFTETCSESEAKKCVGIIKNAVDEALSETRQLDLLTWILSNGIIFLARGSKKITTMKYNLCVMANDSLEFVSCTKSIEDLKLIIKSSRQAGCTTLPPMEMPIEQIQLIKDQKISTNFSKQTVMFNRLDDDKLTTTENKYKAAYYITLEKNKLLPYVSAFANDNGGELLYGVSTDGIVDGVKIFENEKEEIRKRVKKAMNSLVMPKHNGGKFWEITFLPVKDPNDPDLKLYVIKISVKPCSGGVFIAEPESYYVVKNGVGNLPISKWMKHVERSTTELSDEIAFIEFKENEIAFDRIFLPNDYQIFLESLEWVKGFRIADKNEECGTRHLEIVCKLGEVPRTHDIVKYFGEQILPFITYQKESKREWFEENIFDENCDMKQEYEDKLMSLPWVEDFYIGVTSEPEKSWQIYITCAPNTVPSMADLKREFGVDIASFVDFIQGSVDEGSEDIKEPLPSYSYLRGPISGDELCVQEDKGGYGAIGILTGDGKKHYATTCYHVCFKKDFPKTDIEEGHRILQEDNKNKSPGCEGATCVYKTEEGKPLLGQFYCGLYDEHHDIALIELQTPISCSDTVEFLAEQCIRPALADKKEVKDMFYGMVQLPVEIIHSKPTKRARGLLFAITGVTRCQTNRRCYRVKRSGKKDFATEGNSGSLVYLLYEGEKIPFAYVCMVNPESGKNIYYCRNMRHSLEELIKRRMPESSMKPCLKKCGRTPAV